MVLIVKRFFYGRVHWHVLDPVCWYITPLLDHTSSWRDVWLIVEPVSIAFYWILSHNITHFSQAMYEELLNEVKQLKIIAKGQEKRIMLLESKLSASNGSPTGKRKTNNNATARSNSSSSIELTDPIQVWLISWHHSLHSIISQVVDQEFYCVWQY